MPFPMRGFHLYVFGDVKSLRRPEANACTSPWAVFRDFRGRERHASEVCRGKGKNNRYFYLYLFNLSFQEASVIGQIEAVNS